MTQIMGLSNLAPDIQEALLFLPPDENTANVDWKAKRQALNPLHSM
jgi:hypothetical protein